MTQPLYHVWRLTPVASPDDPAWQGRKIWKELSIVAESAGQALFLASEYDKDQSIPDDHQSQDFQQARSGFEDERLYRVDRLDGPVPTAGIAGQVISAR